MLVPVKEMTAQLPRQKVYYEDSTKNKENKQEIEEDEEVDKKSIPFS